MIYGRFSYSHVSVDVYLVTRRAYVLSVGSMLKETSLTSTLATASHTYVDVYVYIENNCVYLCVYIHVNTHIRAYMYVYIYARICM